MPRSNCRFRTLSVQDAIFFGFSILLPNVLVWSGAGILVGALHHFLLRFLVSDGGSFTLAERLVEAILITMWPLSIAVGSASLTQDGERPSLPQVLKFHHMFSLAFSVFSLLFVSLGGALVLQQILVWIFPGEVKSLPALLMGPVSTSAGMALYSLMMLGGGILGLAYAFAPFVAFHEGKEFLEAMERSRHLSRELKLEMFFLYGFLFIEVTLGFFTVAFLPKEPTLLNRVVESLVLCWTVGLGGAVWNHAYRQAIALDEFIPDDGVLQAHRRHIVPDSALDANISEEP
ncbi:MAG: hypothetical protein IPP35_10385 [Elusimicrobia bacterium]|nr:hypothetical protein [Elusimicrobiota bacterium]